LAAHFHDTFDNAIENILVAISFGIAYLIKAVEQLTHQSAVLEVALTQRPQEEMFAPKTSYLPYRMLA
jgi:hypothetical protein